MTDLLRAALLVSALAGPALADPVAVTVTARAETEGTRGDADDPAIWVHPADPAASLILGTDKTADHGGLYVHDLTGARLAHFADGKLNNVDIRPYPGRDDLWIAGASERTREELVFYTIDAAGTVARAAPFAHPAAPAALVDVVDDIYGFALQRDPASGRIFALVNYKSGHVLQWELINAGAGLQTRFVRMMQVGSQPEGMVADDTAGHIYVGEEDVAIWRFDGAPEAGTVATRVAAIGDACLPVDDVEGLAIYDGADRRFLVASAQGIHRAALFDLGAEGLPCAALVEVAAGAIDGVTETDGLEVTAAPLGPEYPQGALVMMDDQNAGFTTNFKIVSWADIAAGLD